MKRTKRNGNLLIENYRSFFGAGDRTRTGTVLLPGDFKSPVSTDSTTPATVGMG